MKSAAKLLMVCWTKRKKRFAMKVCENMYCWKCASKLNIWNINIYNSHPHTPFLFDFKSSLLTNLLQRQPPPYFPIDSTVMFVWERPFPCLIRGLVDVLLMADLMNGYVGGYEARLICQWIAWWLVYQLAERVSAAGSLSYFALEH